MAEEINYQINGQLADNLVTVDNKEDKILVPVSNGSADQARIIAEMKAEDSGLREETILHVFALRNRVVKRLLLSGISVNDGITYASIAFRGTIENSQWDPERNSIVANFSMGAELRTAIKKTKVNIIGEKASAMYIGSVTDASTRAQDSSATAGRVFSMSGAKIKVVGTDKSVGITLTSESGVVTKITEDLYAENKPSKVAFIIPADLANGTYTVKLTTQYSSNNQSLLKTPRSLEKIIYIGTAPAGGGGSQGGDSGEDQNENPLG